MRIRTRYLGVLLAALAVGAFAGTAIADDSSASAAAEPSEAVVADTPADQPSAPVADDTSAPAAAEESAAADAQPSDETAASAESAASEPAASEPAASGGFVAVAGDTPAEPAGGDAGATADDTSSSASDTTTTTETHPVTTVPEGAGTSVVDCKEGIFKTVSLVTGTSAAMATFTIQEGCSLQFTLASFTTPGPGLTFPQQLFASSSGTFGGGTHTLTVALPSCFFQVDLIRGTAPSVLTSPNMSGGPPIAFAFGGTDSDCNEVVTPPTTTTTETRTTPTTETTPPNTTPPSTQGVTPPVTTSETSTTTPTTTTETTTTAAPTTTTETSGTSPATQTEVAGESAGKENVLGAVAQAAHLPFTGLSLLIVAVSGIILLLIGLVLRASGRRRSTL